jgi:AcrR family transcriptional regulator
VDAGLVHYYFGSKQQLFMAAMELPVDIAQVAPAILAGPPDELGERLARFILDLWGQPRARQLMLGAVRSATSDPVAAGLLRRLLAEGPFAVIARAIDRPDADLRATLVGSQLVGLAMARYVVGVEPLASAADETIAKAVGPTLQHYLVGDLGTAPDDGGGGPGAT